MTEDVHKNALHERIAELLARYGKDFTDFEGLELSDVNQHGHGEDCPLHIAARHGLLDDASPLIDVGANVDAPGDIGLTPLHYAAMWGHAGMVRLLLKAGAKLDTTNDFGESPLRVAEQGHHVDVVTLLRHHGARS